MSTAVSELSGYATLAEPDLVFGDSRTDKHPLRGLIDHGPYSSKFGAPTRLRLALLAPKGETRKLVTLTEELKRPAQPREAINYYPTYPGFLELFRIPISDLEDSLQVAFPDDLACQTRREAGTGARSLPVHRTI